MKNSAKELNNAYLEFKVADVRAREKAEGLAYMLGDCVEPAYIFAHKGIKIVEPDEEYEEGQEEAQNKGGAYLRLDV